jgi:hypothetical protein
VVASNRELFDAKSYAELVSFAAKFGVDLGVPLNRAADGAWSMLPEPDERLVGHAPIPRPRHA